MDFPTPPRSSGRHWRDDPDDELESPRQRFRTSPRSEYVPAPDWDRDVPTDPTMPAPLNQVPRRPVRPARDGTTRRLPERRPVEVVVPRVFVEPDEQMDKLRARSLRWGIFRDIVLSMIGLYLLGSWVVPPVLRAFGF